MNILFVIPARGGSKGIPRKNVRLMAGQPLISYSIQNALKIKYDSDVVVSTDDEEIERISLLYGSEVIKRPFQLATDNITLDPVIYHAVMTMEQLRNKIYDIVITLQPTSPLLKSCTLNDAISFFIERKVDTVISGINSPHLSWTEKDGKIVPLYKERLNRQFLPKYLIETGAFFITKRKYIQENSRFGPCVSIFEVPSDESIDIDSPWDWWIAEKEISKKNILIRVEGYPEIGLGHVYRGLLLAYNLIDHNIKFITSNISDLAIKKIKSSNFPYDIIENDAELERIVTEFNCNILINDILDTDVMYIRRFKNRGVRVINFEDMGPGAAYADAVINDLYEKKNHYINHYWGSDYYCIRDEFLLSGPAEFKESVSEVLILFGGTDPCNLTQKVLDVIRNLGIKEIHYTFILGLGYEKAHELISKSDISCNIDIIIDVKLMTEYMKKADIAISSQGRTMLELASMEVPTILLAQNEREQEHEFGYLKNGFINLGLGTEVEEKTIKETLLWLINSPQIRKQMKEHMRNNDLKKGIKRVRDIILGYNV